MNERIKCLKNKNYEQQLIKAVNQRNITAIDSLCNNLGIKRSDLLKTLGDEWLIYVNSKEALDWFWLLLMKPEEYQEMLSEIIQQAITLLIAAGYKPDRDFKTINCNGQTCISYLSQKAIDSLISLVPIEDQHQIHKLFQQSTNKQSLLRK